MEHTNGVGNGLVPVVIWTIHTVQAQPTPSNTSHSSLLSHCSLVRHSHHAWPAASSSPVATAAPPALELAESSPSGSSTPIMMPTTVNRSTGLSAPRWCRCCTDLILNARDSPAKMTIRYRIVLGTDIVTLGTQLLGGRGWSPKVSSSSFSYTCVEIDHLVRGVAQVVADVLHAHVCLTVGNNSKKSGHNPAGLYVAASELLFVL